MCVCVGTEDLASCFRIDRRWAETQRGWVSHPSWAIASKTETQRSLLSKCARRNARWSCEDLKNGCWKSELVPATSRFLGWNETWGLRWTKNKMILILCPNSEISASKARAWSKKIIGFRCQPPSTTSTAGSPFLLSMDLYPCSPQQPWHRWCQSPSEEYRRSESMGSSSEVDFNGLHGIYLPKLDHKMENPM